VTTNTIPDQPPTGAQPPVCVACVGDGTDPATRQMCLRCMGTGLDPDPAAPAGLEQLAAGAPCPAGCIREGTGAPWPRPAEPERLRANEDGELSCPDCWDVFGFAAVDGTP
jgi:hypothetical protein